MARKSEPWPVPPLFEADWRDMPDSFADDLRTRLTRGRRLIIQLAFGGPMDRFRVAALPFWPGWTAVEALMGAEEDPCVAAFLYGPFGAELLDGRSEVIHDINERHGVLLDTEARRRAYLHFFTSAVRGDDGPFFLIESDARLAQLTGKKPRGAAKGLAHPVRSRAGDDDRTLHDAVVLYGDGLFRSTFAVAPGGMVMMEEDEPVVQGHPRPAVFFEGGLRRPAA